MKHVCLILNMLFAGLPMFAHPSPVGGGDVGETLSLQEAIFLARQNSVDAAVALNKLKTAYWQYRSYRADLLPEVNLRATLPNFNKTYSAYQQNDGSFTYLRNSYLNVNGEISIDQNIWLTGGTLSLTTSLDYLHQIGNSGAVFNGKGSINDNFMTIPFALTLTQPIFGVNSTKWKRRIEPVQYEEAKADYITATEKVTMIAINYFFNLLLAKENVGIARQNLENAEKLFEVAKAKREMGQISKNDLLQMELNVLEARSTLTENESTMKSAMFQLQSFLALEDTTSFELVIPEIPADISINYNNVLEKAHRHNSFAQNIRRRQLEADYEVAQAKGNLRQINLFAKFGFTGTDHVLADSYRALKDNQVVQVGVTIPLIDWGKRRGKVRVAESNREVTRGQLRKEEMEFDQNIFILVEQFNNQKQQLQIATRADEIAHRRYETNVETYMIGKLSTLDLNDSQATKDEARRKQISELFYYWHYYYQIRSLTLWDWEKDAPISFKELTEGLNL